MSAENLNGTRVYQIGPFGKSARDRKRRPTMLIPLPRALWRPAGRCKCPACVQEDGSASPSFWDTLAVCEGTDHTWTVHAPDLQPGGNPGRWLHPEGAGGGFKGRRAS